jgi:3-hydroxybutyryl-CoA dehydrogenase
LVANLISWEVAVEKIGVVGAGQMGSGIAHVAALSGCEVLLFDVAQAQLEKALAGIRKNLRRQADKGIIEAAEMEPAMGRIGTTIDLEDFAACDFIIEAVPEDEQLKLDLFRKLDRIATPEAILASNTSSISITRLAGVTERPEKVIGMHFMNPVPVMTLVEVIRGLATSDETCEATLALAQAMGKEVAAARDYPGFIVNRVLIPMINEAIYAHYEGVGTVEDIDKAMTLGTHQPMGPLTLADFIGLDTVLAIMNVLHRGYGDPKYRPCPLLVKMVEAGRLGRKAGRGFYSYD